MAAPLAAVLDLEDEDGASVSLKHKGHIGRS